ncbi:MFS transporter [Caldicoprobacter faecalis]|uniref:MFS transporter, PPP family, 3-phenylpropionic acid transporter n=1 Tax=Caldicoprobacter faecalis TaxID=937334 RepID=A0A1I5USZ0_9FIRM|nr:MFS transporter [Caldicoprobacter faecalis]SFP98312.1 MFS transporter, PPP family, 3-phenylpropionic acid transporter [Caldicoprobacter faecalis]
MKNLLIKIRSIHPKQLQYSVLEFIFWATFAAYYPFVVVFLRNKGFSNTIIGTIVAINSLVVVFAQPFWGIVSDRIQSVKKVFIICLTAAIILLQPVSFISSAVFVGIVLALVTAFESPLAPLLDSWVIQGIKTEKNLYYGSIRVWGSIGFAVMVYIYGRLVDSFSTDVLFPILLLMGCLTVITCIGIKTDRPVSSDGVDNLNFTRLLKNYAYMSFLIFAMVIIIPHRSAFIFLPNLMELVGGSDGELGMVFTIMAISEIPIFLYSKILIRKFKPINLILFSTIFFILRQALYLVSTTPFHVLAIQLLQGPSFALFTNGAVYYIDELAPSELKATAQTFANSIFFGVSGIIGSYVGGWIIDSYGLRSIYWVGVFVSIAISVLFFFSLNINRILRCRSIDI